MPNEVYEAAVSGLSSLVSPRVAKRIVDESLRATSRTPDDVSRSAMRRLLLSRIKRELEGVMPAAAIGPGLKQLAADIERAPKVAKRPWWRRGGSGPDPDRAEAGQPQAEDQRRSKQAGKPHGDAFASADSPSDRRSSDRRASDRREAERRGPQRRGKLPAPETIGVTRSSIYLPDVPLPAMAAVAGDAPREGGDALSAAAVADRAAGTEVVAVPDTAENLTGEGAGPAARDLQLELTPGLVERAFRVFADLETVKQIVAVQRGAVLRSRGTGIDPKRLEGISVATTALLSRAGTLRVFSLEHETGVLFLFPTRDGALVVLTQPKVNIGAVLSARAALEEAA